MQKYSWVKKGINAAASGCVLNSCIPLKGRIILCTIWMGKSP